MSSRSFGRVVVTEIGLTPNSLEQVPIELYGTIDSKRVFGGPYPGEGGIQASGIWRVCNLLIDEAENLQRENERLKMSAPAIKALEDWFIKSRDSFPSGPEHSEFGPAIDKVVDNLKKIRMNLGDAP